MYILAIVGSPRLGGNTSYLVDQALRQATELGARTEKIILSEYKVSPCLGHENCSGYYGATSCFPSLCLKYTRSSR